MGVKIYQQKQEALMATKEESKENLDTADLTHMVNRIKEKTNLSSTDALITGICLSRFFSSVQIDFCKLFHFV